jgi:hypothetical protein
MRCIVAVAVAVVPAVAAVEAAVMCKLECKTHWQKAASTCLDLSSSSSKLAVKLAHNVLLLRQPIVAQQAVADELQCNSCTYKQLL